MSGEFAEFAARKTAAAADAVIERFTTEVDNGAGMDAIGNPWSRRMFDGAFYLSPAAGSSLPSASLVFVRSRDGNTVAANPSTLGGGEADKHLIYEGLSRVAADAVLGGAGTIHGHIVLSVWRRELVDLRAALGLPRHPMQVIATLRGVELETGMMFNTPELAVAVVTVPRGHDAMREALRTRPWVTPIVMSDANDLPNAFRQLRDLGVSRLSCIGGRTLAQPLLDAGLIQDMYLTTSPISAGAPMTPFYSQPLAGRIIVRKHGTGADHGVTFDHIAL